MVPKNGTQECYPRMLPKNRTQVAGMHELLATNHTQNVMQARMVPENRTQVAGISELIATIHTQKVKYARMVPENRTQVVEGFWSSGRIQTRRLQVETPPDSACVKMT